MRIGRIVGKGDKLRADHCVCLCRDDAHVGDSSVRCRNVDFHVDDLARCICLNICRCIVCEEVPFAGIDLASSGIEVFLARGYLSNVLDVSLNIGGLVVVHCVS